MSPDKKEKLLELAVEPWHCLNDDPPTCNWPDCGCDPYASEIINTLVDDGWKAPPCPQERADG